MTKQSKQSPNPVKSFQQHLDSMQIELVGLALLVICLITLLSLLSITSGAISDGWANLLRQVFGWGAIPVTLCVGWLGAVLLVDKLRRGSAPTDVSDQPDLPDGRLRWEMVIGIELLLVTCLALLHLFAGGDDSLASALAGRGGGLLGWGVSSLLAERVGQLVTSLMLLGLLVIGVGFFLRPSLAGIFGSISSSRAFGRNDQDIDDLQEMWDAAEERISRSGKKRKAKPKISPEVESLTVHSVENDAQPSTRRSKALPSLDLLVASAAVGTAKADVRYQAQTIEDTLQGFGVPAKVTEVNVGPTVTQFGVEPGYIEKTASDGTVKRQRVRVSKITGLVNDLALALSAAPIRIEAPVPGRPVVGIEVPNSKASLVSLRGVLESKVFQNAKGALPIALGRDVSGAAVVADLASMPHLLIAGATGSGKSVCINAIITSLLFDHQPEDLKFLMIDPKMVELTGYAGVAHLLSPVIVDLDQVVGALTWITRLMKERYEIFSKLGVRNVRGYNKKSARRKDLDHMPYIVVIIDELADLMMMAPDEIERSITRIAQMARATGIHMVIATQRPSVDVVTGLIKANFPARVAFAVTSQIDSRVILDTPGADRLLGRGDALLMLPNSAKLRRLQGCFVSDQEILRVVNFWNENVGAATPTVSRPWDWIMEEAAKDDMLEEAIEIVLTTGRASTTHLQRRLGIGYPRAARLMDQLEEEGIIGPADGSHPRDILINSDNEEEDSFDEFEE